MGDTPKVWAFDPGKGSNGEAVRDGDQFHNQTSLRLLAAFGKNKTGEVAPAGFVLETLLNRCIRLADREPVCAI